MPIELYASPFSTCSQKVRLCLQGRLDPLMVAEPLEQLAQTVARMESAFDKRPWLGDAFGSFTGNPARLPVDTHSTVAMIAPRGLLMMDNPHIDWLAARSLP